MPNKSRDFLRNLFESYVKFWNWTEKKFFFKWRFSSRFEKSLQLDYHLLPLKALLWRWKAFLGRNSTACFNLNCICLLIHRTNCCSACRSQPATCRTPEAGSCLSPEVGSSTGTSVALRNILVACVWSVRCIPPVETNPHCISVKHGTWKSGESSKLSTFLLHPIAFFKHFLLVCGYFGKYMVMFFRTAACHSQSVPKNYSGSCCLL